MIHQFGHHVESSRLARRLDVVIDRAIAENRIVGTVVLVAEDGRCVYERTAGWADRTRRTPIALNTIFRLASVTKPILTAAAMRLTETGHIHLNDPVTRWLPDFTPRLDDGSETEILIRHLLSHTAGLSYRFLEPQGSPYHGLNISDGLDQPGLSVDENLRRLASAPLSFRPGTAWRYSLALDVLGAILASALGKGLPDVVSELVTRPLGMTDTGFAVSDPDRLATPHLNSVPVPKVLADGMAVPFGEGAVRFYPSRIFDPLSYPSGGAGMTGTATDVLTFLETIRTGGGSILQPDTVQAMTTDQVGPQAETQGPGWGFGFGWAVLCHPNVAATQQSKGTIQWGGVYGHSWFVDGARNLSVVAFTNTALEGMCGAFPSQVRDAIYE
jgi:CubicO group peptidase (beta-lactamase class C family)